MSRLDDELLAHKMAKCEKCGGRLVYKYSGIYECEDCHVEVYDDFGRVKKYIEDHGPSSANEISMNTGVELSTINKFLRLGRVEIPEGSGYYITCNICGAPIRYGRYCMECAMKNSNGGVKGTLMDEAGERIKGSGRMHYLGENHLEEENERKRKHLMNNEGSGMKRSGRKLDLNEEKNRRSGERTLDLRQEDKSTRRGGERKLDLKQESSKRY